MTPEPDDLIAAARDGSRDALGELYRRHADAIHALAYRITASPDDASDVVQDVFVGLPRALRSYDDRGRFESWLKQVTVRTCLMRMRSRKRKREESFDDALVETVESPSSHPLDMIAVKRAVAQLAEPLRTVFVLRELEGYTHAEIADMLGISSANSATRVSRAWSLLRKELQR